MRTNNASYYDIENHFADRKTYWVVFLKGHPKTGKRPFFLNMVTRKIRRLSITSRAVAVKT